MTFIIGLIFSGLPHLIIPICLLFSREKHPKKTLWLMAFLGGFLGFMVCVVISESYMGLGGILITGFWTLVSYAILRITRYKKPDYKNKD